MNLMKKTLLLVLVLLWVTIPGYACMMDDTQTIEGNLNSGILDQTSISLFNDSAQGITDDVTLFALNLSDPSLPYDLQFQTDDSSDWMSFNSVFGSREASSLGLMSHTFNQPGILDLNLRLFDGSDVVSETASLYFHELQYQENGHDWYSWAELEWFDADGEALDVTTALWAWVPWDNKDLIGPEALPIPGTGLLLMIGVVGLIGFRRNIRFRNARR
jgi:hypothetical protein